MAKKTSAKSQGYRKTVQKKPYLTKKEIIITVSIIAALILAFVLFNIFYDDGSLKVKDGVVQTRKQSDSEHRLRQASHVLQDRSAERHRWLYA